MPQGSQSLAEINTPLKVVSTNLQRKKPPSAEVNFIFSFKIIIYLFMAALGLNHCTWAFYS